MNVAVIGGGASGLMAGGVLSQNGITVTIFDGNEKPGKKIYITGKGRCNVTNAGGRENYLENVVNGKRFMFSAINRFDSKSTMDLFESLGCPLKIERGNRVFPKSDKASDITKSLLKYAGKCEIKLNEKVEKIEKKDDKFLLTTSKSRYLFDKVIVATGGKSYSSTGSKGDGYRFAKEFGLNVLPPRPALVPIKIKDKFCRELEGLSLKNVTLYGEIAGKKYSFFGEMLFSHDAITGPIALTMSSFIGDKSDVKLYLDLKPALSEQTLDNRLIRDFQNNLNKEIFSVAKGLLPKSLADVFLKMCSIDRSKKVNSVTKNERERILNNLKKFTLEFECLYPLECGIVTAGGVDLKEINPKTMECKKVSGLYFIGEVLDIDCLTGGYNLQTAFSTAYASARGIIEGRE